MTDQKPFAVTKLHVLGTALASAAFTMLGGFSLHQAVSLRLSESVAIARVVESRAIPMRRGDTSYEVRYVFSPEPGAPEIARSDFLGRSNLWSPLPEPEWKVATDTMQLPIRYDPRRPGNNTPEVSVPDNLKDSAAMLVLGLIIGGVALFAELRRRGQPTPAG